MKITEINLKEEGAKYYCKEGLENFIVRCGDLVGENSGVDITCVFTIGRIMDIEFERVETVKNPYERVNIDEEYYYIAKNSKVLSADEQMHRVDDNMLKELNYFNNENYAEYIAFKENLIRRIDKFAWEHNEGIIDWENNNTEKFYICYDYFDKKLGIRSVYGSKEVNIYFTSEENAEKALKEFKEDLIKLYTWKFDF